MSQQSNFFYADSDEQLGKANTFLVVADLLSYALIAVIVIISAMYGIRSINYTINILSIILAVIVITLFLYFKNKKDIRIKYIANIGLLFITYQVGIAYDGYYMRFATVLPFIVNIVYLDKRFFAIFGFLSSAVTIFITIMNSVVYKKYMGDAINEQRYATIILCFMMILIYFVISVLTLFNKDMIGSIKHEKEKQENTLNNVLSVAANIREMVTQALDKMNELFYATKNFSISMQEISDTTQATAESIEIQTNMTNSIQSSLHETVSMMEQILTFSSISENINNKNDTLANKLQDHSYDISVINSNVLESVKQLEENMTSVKQITNSINKLSRQTTLLALNASIESARAGEAGKGFAVVSDEIRKLADETKNETNRIELILHTLFESMENVKKEIDSSMSATKVQEEIIKEVIGGMHDIKINVIEVNNGITSAEAMLSNLSSANDQIVDNIMRLSATTEEISANTSQSEEISKENLEKASITRAVLDNILNESYKLD